MRDFTPRHYDPQRSELWIDFFVHDTGPATRWASEVAPGHTLIVGGPKGSAVIDAEGIDLHVLVGDETAVPAIARRLEELPSQARAMVFIESETAVPWLPLQSRAQFETRWVARGGEAQPGAALLAALDAQAPWPPRTFFWIAGESRTARALRRTLREVHGVDLAWIKASGYWQRGAVGAHEKIADDA